MLEANQDREMADALEKISEFVEEKIPIIPGNWPTEITSILLQKSHYNISGETYSFFNPSCVISMKYSNSFWRPDVPVIFDNDC